jgi:hypothetical protein
MATIIPFLQNGGAFGPDDIKTMSDALDDICKLLKLPDGEHPTRMVVAERIIALARQGRWSPTLLRDRILREAGLAPLLDGGSMQGVAGAPPAAGSMLKNGG